MLFNSLDFLFFLPVVFFCYWFLSFKSYHFQNLYLFLASFYFYACWDFRFLFLLLLSIFINYLIGVYFYEKNQFNRKFVLIIGLVLNIGILLYFKYFNFFVDTLFSFFNSLGFTFSYKLLNIVLPVGISFYTFHGISYIVDLYHRKIVAEKNIINYSLFVSFFPLLVAGPIERATNLLPQIQRKRTFTYEKGVSAMRQILWGFFKKIVIADVVSDLVDLIFTHSNEYAGLTLLLGLIFFSIQIYADFSGYTDIALGVARLFGFELLQNFSFPYFSTSISEFWRRWHISLTSWFRDYLYIPLGGSRVSKFKQTLNTLIVFVISGFWHGANWTFVCWGIVNALYFIPSIFMLKSDFLVSENSLLNKLYNCIKGTFVFLLISIAWVFFRSATIENSFHYLTKLFCSLFSNFSIIDLYNFIYWKVDKFHLLVVFLFFLVEWFGRRSNFALEFIGTSLTIIQRYLMYFILLALIFWYVDDKVSFIYFQF